MNKQVQRGGDKSTNIQAGEVHIVGISYTEAHKIALDVFKTNFLSLSDRAAKIALARVEEITEKFLRKLKEQNEKGIAHAQDPDFQYALFTVQKEYARTGDKELGDLLVDLLVDRTKHENRSIKEIVLNESLSIAPKLTNDQLATLSIIFLFKYTKNHSLNNLTALSAYLDRYIEPFSRLISKNVSCYRHLEYTGCGSINIAEINLIKIFLRHYRALFFRGFPLEEILEKKKMNVPITSPMFIRCLHDQEKHQINSLDNDGLRKKAIALDINEEDINKLIKLNNSFLMSTEKAKEYLEQTHPYMSIVFDVWENSYMKNFTLTSVGISIGHANVKRLVGEFTDLSIWIN